MYERTRFTCSFFWAGGLGCFQLEAIVHDGVAHLPGREICSPVIRGQRGPRRKGLRGETPRPSPRVWKACRSTLHPTPVFQFSLPQARQGHEHSQQSRWVFKFSRFYCKTKLKSQGVGNFPLNTDNIRSLRAPTEGQAMCLALQRSKTWGGGRPKDWKGRKIFSLIVSEIIINKRIYILLE